MQNDELNSQPLPSDVQSIIHSLKASNQDLEESNLSLQESKHQLTLENDHLREQIALLRAKLFGKSSEKNLTTSEAAQLALFEELLLEEEEGSEEEEETIEVPSHQRKKAGRKPLSPDLPRKEVIIDLEEEQKQCPCGHHLTAFGEERSEKLEYVPADLYVKVLVRPKYVCKQCEGIESENNTVQIANLPKTLIPGSFSTPSLLTQIMLSRFEDALPFYRQEKQFRRLGVELPRATMSNWAIQISEKCQDLMEVLKEEMLKSPALQIDETTLQVLREPNRSPNTKSYMWVIRSIGPPDEESGKQPIGILYHYHENRSSDVAKSLLGSYKGVVQSDGYKGYDYLDHQEGVIHVGCFAHARRKFTDVITAGGKKARKKKGNGKAQEALDFIAKLYAIEKVSKSSNITGNALLKKRGNEAKPVLLEFKEWLGEIQMKVPAKSLLGTAINYALNQWHRLEKYIESPLITPDNNGIENAIRPFTLGRKNWLFANTPGGAKASATLYSLIETAKANQLNPQDYLLFLFTHLPNIKDKTQLRSLLPFFLQQSDISQD